MACDHDLNLESPLEAIFYVWWQAAHYHGRHHALFHIRSQHEVICDNECFRLDFVIDPKDDHLERLHVASTDWQFIGVEVDGHEFHEKTREQVATRNRRDRVLQQAGWRVFHFSWAEMTVHPFDCIREVALFALDQLERLSQESFWRARFDEALASGVFLVKKV